MDLFQEREQETQAHSDFPLSVRMRPESLDDFIGQEHILGQGKILRRNIQADRLFSLILWGPPGCGKTSLANIISKKTGARFVYLNGSFCSSQDIKKEISQAYLMSRSNKKTVLFIDEIHRINRIQQDILIQDTENSKVTLIGATTYNPFFYINPALISRSLVCEFKPLEEKDIILILEKALEDKQRGLGRIDVNISRAVLNFIAKVCSGDARKALRCLELGVLTSSEKGGKPVEFSLALAKETIQVKPALYDQKGDYHYDLVSALIKSIRGSDIDAGLYWLARMLYSGEDPRFICRRLIILAAEDIGLADPFALVLANACFDSVERVGMPEAKIILGQTVIYLAESPKSNSAYLAISRAWQDIEKGDVEQVPMHLKDTHYSQAGKTGRGKGYKYPHQFGGYVKQEYRAKNKKYYFAESVGKEAEKPVKQGQSYRTKTDKAKG
jgi:putative ATPase